MLCVKDNATDESQVSHSQRKKLQRRQARMSLVVLDRAHGYIYIHMHIYTYMHAWPYTHTHRLKNINVDLCMGQYIYINILPLPTNKMNNPVTMNTPSAQIVVSNIILQ